MLIQDELAQGISADLPGTGAVLNPHIPLAHQSWETLFARTRGAPTPGSRRLGDPSCTQPMPSLTTACSLPARCSSNSTHFFSRDSVIHCSTPRDDAQHCGFSLAPCLLLRHRVGRSGMQRYPPPSLPCARAPHCPQIPSSRGALSPQGALPALPPQEPCSNIPIRLDLQTKSNVHVVQGLTCTRAHCSPLSPPAPRTASIFPAPALSDLLLPQ